MGSASDRSRTRYGNFNHIIEKGVIMGLESNVPIQFFDVDSEGDLQPNGFKNYQSMLSGQRRI